MFSVFTLAQVAKKTLSRLIFFGNIFDGHMLMIHFPLPLLSFRLLASKYKIRVLTIRITLPSRFGSTSFFSGRLLPCVVF
jgi:hypothetical protein